VYVKSADNELIEVEEAIAALVTKNNNFLQS